MLLVLLSIIFRLFLDHLQLNHHRTQSNSLSEIPFKIKKGILKVTKNKTKKNKQKEASNGKSFHLELFSRVHNQFMLAKVF